MKVIILYQSVLFAFYVYLLANRFQAEEILFLYLLPVLGSLFFGGAVFTIRKLSKKKTKLQAIFKLDLLPLAVVQTILLIIIFFLIHSNPVSKKDLVSDLNELQIQLEEIHPDYYHSASRLRFQHKFDSLKSVLPEEMSETRAYRILSGFLALLNDTHTRAGEDFYRQRMRLIFLRLFPYKVKIQGDRIFVVRNYAYKSKIPPGAEIITINGKKPKAFLKDVSRLLSYHNEYTKNEHIGPVLIGLWNDFENFIISYQDPAGERIYTIRSAGGLFANIAILWDRMKCLGPPHHTFKQIEKRIGYIGFRRFGDANTFGAFLEKSFKIISEKSIGDVIIDIRNNSGDNSSLGDELMQYIAKKPFIMNDSVDVKISQALLAAGYFQSKDMDQRAGEIVRFRSAQPTVLRNNPLRFSGNVYLLVNGKTFSGAAGFAAAFKCNEIGPVIGSETGGCLVDFDDRYTYHLRRTGLPVTCAWKKVYRHCGEEERGVQPDVQIENGYVDIIDQRDRVMEVALNMVKKKPVVK